MRCPNPRYVWPKGRVIAVPCGKCLACLANRRHDWAFRLMQEHKVSLSAHFVTLTYHEKFCPDAGVSKRHLQLYFKRLRKRCPRLRYYAVGEYGAKTQRPHYHAIVFNCDEESIRQAWCLSLLRVCRQSIPIGIVHLGSVSEASVQYVLKYVVQKEDGPEGLTKPFAIMSRGHGLGAHYLTDAMVDWHRRNEAVYAHRFAEKVRLPRFYKEKIWPDSSWSDWAEKRSQVFKKAQEEAELKERINLAMLKADGYDEIHLQEFRDARISRIKRKVAFSQTL